MVSPVETNSSVVIVTADPPADEGGGLRNKGR